MHDKTSALVSAGTTLGSDNPLLCCNDFHGELFILYVGAEFESVELLNAYKNTTVQMGCYPTNY